MSYLESLAAKGGRLADGRVVSFGDVESETSAALGGSGSLSTSTPLLAAGVLRAVGPDARDFLHGQLAADVKGLGPSEQVLSLLLNHKGHALADVAVVRVGEGFLLLVDDAKADLVEASLVEHIVFDDVAVSRVPGFAITVQGAGWDAALRALGMTTPEGRGVTGSEPEAGGASVHAFRRQRSARGGADLLIVGDTAHDSLSPEQAAEQRATVVLEQLAQAGSILVGEAALAAARVEAMVPAAASEGGDGVLPQEAGMVERLSYRKGCYLGQEIMARIEARGNLKRALALLSVEGLAPDDAPATAGSPVTLEGRPVGRLGTLARLPAGGAAALAVLRRDVPEDAALEVSSGTAARVREWLPL